MKETGPTSAGSVVKNFLWRLAERIGAQGVKLLVELVLARILLPEQYGLIAMVTVFITGFNVFVDSGLGNALIHRVRDRALFDMYANLEDRENMKKYLHAYDDSPIVWRTLERIRTIAPGIVNTIKDAVRRNR